MIGIYAKIPFHGQLKSSEPELAASLAEVVNEAAVSFKASLLPVEESFFLCFDDAVHPCRLRAAEAARFLASRLTALSPRLHGWALLLDACAGPAEEALRSARRLWYGIEEDGLYLTPGALGRFAPYFRTASDTEGPCLRVEEAPYAARALPTEGAVPPFEDRVVDRLVDAIGDTVLDESRTRCIAVIGPGNSARNHLESALERLYKGEAGGFLRLEAQAGESSPYGPIAEGLARLAPPSDLRPGPAELLSGAERGLLEELPPILDFLRRSPYRASYSPTLDVRLRLRAQAAVRLYARERRYHSLPAFVVLDGIDRYPPETIALLADILLGKLSEEGVTVLIAGAALPDSWPLAALRRATVPAPGPMAIAKAAKEAAEYLDSPSKAYELAAVAAGDPFRLRLAQRLAIAGQPLDAALTTPLLVAQVLRTFPSEYAELFLALRMGEGVLGNADLDDFLDSIGLVSGLRPLIYAALADLGLVEGGRRPRLRFHDAAAAGTAAIEDGGAAIATAFSARLLDLHEKRTILPSTALYRRIAAGIGGVWGRFGNVKLLLDCLSADEVYGRSEPADRESSTNPLGSMGAYLAAYAVRDREKSLAHLTEIEAAAELAKTEDSPSAVDFAGAAALRGAVSLARACFDYADRKPQAAASRAKASLIALHSQAVRPSEARAHRLLGLCALGQGQVQEGSDYLGNAFELAESLPDPLECILSAQGEAAAHFLLGDLRKARQRARVSASWAEKAFRADWEAVCAFIEGRIDLELGRCGEAGEAFGRVRAEARIYGRDDAAARAEIWTGRAASWAGEGERARELLSHHEGDAEALWFLAELEAWEGRHAHAAELAARALSLVPPREFASADAFSWNSGFESIEGRSVGFGAERSYLEDQILAFRDYAAGFADPLAEGPRRAELLALRTREERLAALHPAAHVFLFYRYLLLERASPSAMDGATALSKAFKALQLRAARIEEASLKDAFMGGNRWNRDLLAEARSRKLI